MEGTFELKRLAEILDVVHISQVGRDEKIKGKKRERRNLLKENLVFSISKE